jgi:hypothetical protein
MVGTLIRRPLPPVSDFIRTLLDDADATTALATLGITTGTFTPTLTNTTNLDASTSFLAQYLRVSDRVIVAGYIEADATALALTELQMALPVASNFTTGVQGGGTGSIFGVPVLIQPSPTTDRMRFIWNATGTANNAITYSFMYQVL